MIGYTPRSKQKKRPFGLPRDTSARGSLQHAQAKANAQAWAKLVAKLATGRAR